MTTCPICKKPATPEHKPFCSKRCADIDLHGWLKGRYAIPGGPVSPDNSTQNDPEED